MATKKPAKQQHTCEVTLIRERGRFLSFVESPDEKAATTVNFATNTRAPT